MERGGQVEIIGWLYQYYNTEPKNAAFAKKGKITKEEIPAVTQLFTPDWIVRYMVENSLGRLWVEHLLVCGDSRTEAEIAADFGWKYYLPEAEQEPEVVAQLEKIREERRTLKPEEIKAIDPCMGSGHICVYLFTVLMQIYENAGYGQREAAKSILENNLYGLDIDDRAFQMAYFAVMMKAREYNRRILNGKDRPNLYSIQESNGIDRSQLKLYGKRMEKAERDAAHKDMIELLNTFVDAKEFGSILSVKIYDWERLERFIEDVDSEEQISLASIDLGTTSATLRQLIGQGRCLAHNYHVVSTNPPYMGSGSMNPKLLDYVKKNYPNGKIDLYSVFMLRCIDILVPKGYSAMITQHSWMFLTSFERLRIKIERYCMINMAHLGARAFEEIAGEVVQTTSFVLQKSSMEYYRGTYQRLVQPNSQQGKEQLFLSRESEYVIDQKNFSKIPSSPIAYWVSDAYISAFASNVSVDQIAQTFRGLQPGNTKFVKEWFEVPFDNIEWESCVGKTWFPMSSGGEVRKWYGNINRVVNWKNEGFDIKNSGNAIIPNEQLYFKPVIGWSRISSGPLSLRYYEKGLIPGDATGCIYANEKTLCFLLGALNSSAIALLWPVLNSNMTNSTGIVSKVPVPDMNCVSVETLDTIKELVNSCIEICRNDWNLHETSWGYDCNQIVAHVLFDKKSSLAKSDYYISAVMHRFKGEYLKKRFSLKEKEEMLDSIFADIYCLKKEADETVDGLELSLKEFDEKKVVKELISYAVGCILGRYSLDKKGIAYAGGQWNTEYYISFKPDEDNVIPITDEEYLEDDIVVRFCEWVKTVFGKNTLEQNLDYIANSVGGRGSSSRERIRNYFLNSFYGDHCQSYTMTGSGKRPIYWLFDSGKQNGFKALIYLHRYNADTIGNMRVEYLHRMQRVYESEIERMQDMIEYSSNNREIAQATKRREKLAKQLKECHEYDEKLAHLALSRINLDLNDGVQVNYRKIQTANDGKFYEVLADSKNIMTKKK